MPTAVRSHAKINLGLYIGAPRPDGFHGLSTVYQTLELHDILTVSAQRAGATAIRMTSNDERVPCNGQNTAWKMVELALLALGITAEVEIHIEKKLPVQGGMGAGSANAVAALIGLERELGISLIGDEFPHWSAKRLEIAAQVGSDVPLFLIGGTSLGLDRGQDVVPLPDIEPTWCVVAVPSVGVSTGQAFRDWDALCSTDGLTQQASTDKLNELSRAYASAFGGASPEVWAKDGSSGVLALGGDQARLQESVLVRTGVCRWIENDFEKVVFAQQPSLRDIKRILVACGTPEAALHASLSGSGSALFGLYATQESAEEICRQLQAAGIEGRLTRTIPRSSYWPQMIL